MIFEICVLLLLLIASAVDIRKKEVPLWELGVAGALSAAKIITDLVVGSFDPLASALALVPGALFLALAFITRQGVGYGDGLLILCIGPALGLYGLALGLIISLFACSLFSGVLLLLKRAKGGTRIPYIPFLTIGMGVMMLAQI